MSSPNYDRVVAIQSENRFSCLLYPAPTLVTVCLQDFRAYTLTAYLSLKRFTEARTRVEEAIKLYPDFANAHDAFGDVLFVQGHLYKRWGDQGSM
jgi:tetratricopeptide (TPR) repeat protein